MMIELPAIPTFKLQNYHSGVTFPINADTHTLSRWMSTRVFPLSVRRQPEIKVTLNGDADSVDKALEMLDSLSQYRSHHNAAETICAAGNTLAREICSEDALSIFELCQSDHGLVLVAVSPRRVGNVGPFLYKRSVQHWRDIRITSGPQYWIINFPPALGGTRKYRKFMRTLSRVGPVVPRHKLESEDYVPDLHAASYRRDYIEFVTSGTRSLGWSVNGSFSEYCTEYYLLKRSLDGKRAKLVLREHLVKSMNAFFKQVGLSCSIVVEGGATMADCGEYGQKLRDGRISTKEFLDWVFHSE